MAGQSQTCEISMLHAILSPSFSNKIHVNMLFFFVQEEKVQENKRVLSLEYLKLQVIFPIITGGLSHDIINKTRPFRSSSFSHAFRSMTSDIRLSSTSVFNTWDPFKRGLQDRDLIVRGVRTLINESINLHRGKKAEYVCWHTRAMIKSQYYYRDLHRLPAVCTARRDRFSEDDGNPW